MNESAYYLTYILEQLMYRVLEEQEELKEKIWKVDHLLEGILAGRYLFIFIGKLFDAAASLGMFKALQKDLQQHITPLVLVEDLKKGDLRQIKLFHKVFGDTCDEVSYPDLDLRALYEEIITEGILLQGKQSEFDEGQLMGYSFCLLTLYNQAPVFVPKLFNALPKKLRKFMLCEQLRSIKKSDLGL